VTTAPPGINPQGNRRRWRDLSAVRITIALLVGSILSLALLIGIVDLIVIALLPNRDWSFGEADWRLSALIVVYSMLAGWAYLLLIPRRRGIISRVECLLLGAVMPLLGPPLLALPWIIISSPPHAKIDIVIENSLYTMRMQPGLTAAYWVALSLFFLPLGLFCGWLLWRIGVKPATARLTDAATVFE
jgi:hypothetical protein